MPLLTHRFVSERLPLCGGVSPRVRRLLAVFFCAFWLVPGLAQAAPGVASFTITAQQIALYTDRSALLADGGVSVRSQALQITSTRALYDVKANTLTATGNVTVTENAAAASGAAYIYDFKTSHGHFLESATLPQYSTSEATAIAQQVELHPATSILFSNAQVRTGSVLTPIASYEYTIPPPGAKDFGYSPVPSAALEEYLRLGADRNAYSFARVRYDRYNGGPGAGLEEHYARTDRGYIAVGQTLDVDGARFDLAAFQRLNASLTQSLTGSSLFGTRSLRYALNLSGREGYSSLSSFQYNNTRSDDLYLTDNQHPIGKVGQLREQVDFGHDVHPTDYMGSQDFRVTPGLHFDTASVRVGRATLSSSADIGESWYDYGRATLATGVSFWDTYVANPKVQFNAGATFTHDAPPFPSTYRTYVVGSTWKASNAFALISSLTYAHDYGQYLGVGRPEFSAAFDVRFRRKNGTGIEVGSIIPFGTGNLYHAGGFNLRFFK